MKLHRENWSRLRNALLLLGMVLFIAIALVFYSGQQKADTAQTLKMQQTQLEEAQRRFQSSGMEKQNIIQYLPIYQRLIQQGIVGEEKREDWIAALRTIHDQHKLFGITYNISKQENYTPEFAVNLGQFALHRSVMKIQFPMLHEGDLLTLLQALKVEQSSMFMVRDCEVTRLSNGPVAKLVTNLQANCTLDWLTISEKQGTAS